jgi:predicted RNase H-like nuclease (RuvC/YqgF family)
MKMDANEKNQAEMFQQLMSAIESMSDTLKSFQAQNEMLKKENIDLRTAPETSKNDSATLKAKDFMIANLQKEVNDLKNKRAETTREMNQIREQINVLKLAAKGEKQVPKSEPKAQAITLKFDDFSDKL